MSTFFGGTLVIQVEHPGMIKESVRAWGKRYHRRQCVQDRTARADCVTLRIRHPQGKRRAAQAPWKPGAEDDARAPVLFLRSFQDDQFDFQRPRWTLWMRWYDLWSFRRNVDEAMVDEVAQYGPVVALGRPGEGTTPFGAARHYSSHDDWQATVLQTARRASAIVLVAGESPGLRWEFDLLHRESLVGRAILLLHPDPAREASNRRAIAWLVGGDDAAGRSVAAAEGRLVALITTTEGPCLLTADEPSPAAYVVALRGHFQRATNAALAGAAVQ